MLPFFRKSKPVADLLTFDDGKVGFRCEVPLVPGQRLQAHCRLPDGGEEFDGVLVIATVGEVNTCTVEKPANANQFLSVLLPPAFVERRAQPRLKKALRVLSREVQGYKCTTIDIGADGVGLLLEGPARVGDQLGLEIDCDMPGVRTLNVQIEVLWALPEDVNRKYRVGGSYLNLSPLQHRTLDKVLEHIRTLRE